MICCYKASMAGPYHIENGLPCQDSYSIEYAEDFICVAVADGLGSEAHSDVGSRIAASSVTNYCVKHFKVGMTAEKVKAIMNNAFVHAYKTVLEAAAEEGNSDDEYDTTLCVAIYADGHIYYGQAGDSGMIALLQDGRYVKVTEQQRDEEGYVYPLCWGPEKWVFGEIDEPVSAVMLMTDGVFEEICPSILKNKEVCVNVPLARKFLDHNETDSELLTELEQTVYSYLENYPRRLLDDDKTIVVVYNTELPAKELEEAYYAIPNWKQLFEDANSKLRQVTGAEDREVLEVISEEKTDETSEIDLKAILGPVNETLDNPSEKIEDKKKDFLKEKKENTNENTVD